MKTAILRGMVTAEYNNCNCVSPLLQLLWLLCHYPIMNLSWSKFSLLIYALTEHFCGVTCLGLYIGGSCFFES